MNLYISMYSYLWNLCISFWWNLLSQGKEILDKSVSEVTIRHSQNLFLPSLRKVPLWSWTFVFTKSNAAQYFRTFWSRLWFLQEPDADGSLHCSSKKKYVFLRRSHYDRRSEAETRQCFPAGVPKHLKQDNWCRLVPAPSWHNEIFFQIFLNAL